MPTHATYTTFHADLPMHAQTMALARACEALGMPARWSGLAYAFVPPLNIWCLANSESGETTHLSDGQLAAICQWPLARKAGAFRAALRTAGFLRLDADGREFVHNFTVYNRRLLEERRRGRDRRKVKGASVDGNGKDPRDEMDQSADASTDGNLVASKDKSKDASLDALAVEERREEKIKNNGEAAVVGQGHSPMPSTRNPEPGTRNTSKAGASRPLALKPGATANGERPAPAHRAAAWEPTAWLDMNIFAAVLRGWGFGEAATRRVVRWIGQEVLPRTSGPDRAPSARVDLFASLCRVLACCAWAQRERAADCAAFAIAAAKRRVAAPDDLAMMARQAWERVEAVEESSAAGQAVGATWLAEELAGLVAAWGSPVQALRPLADVVALREAMRG